MINRTSSLFLACAAASAIALHPGDASAQFYGGVQVGVQAQPQYVQQQPQQVYVQQQPQYVQQQQPQYVQQRPVRMGRVRYGFDLGAGYMFAGGLRGASIVGSFRLGGQLNDQLAIYYQGTLPIGFAAGTLGGVETSGAAIVYGSGLMGEWHFSDLFSAAIGPSIDYAAGEICSGSSGLNCVGGAGAYFGIQARLSITLVAASAGQDTRRYGFRMGISSHTSFIGSGVFQFLDLHLGYEWY
ncbi:MAG: hypothetical protein Q8S73_15440 [Deltaproteobacteria bacterium]|nr:hypothetical protein [Myxococcales bacterium]MDP3215500.1 hypothetical protein [Deltaproteobacteria bacterium]